MNVDAEGKDRELNVVYATDDNYAMHMGVSMVSLLETNSEEFSIVHILVLGNRLSGHSITMLQDQIKRYPKGKLSIYDVTTCCEELKTKKGTSWPSSIFARFFLGRYLDRDASKALYLDCDIIVGGSLKELWETDLTNYCIGAVPEVARDVHNVRLGVAHSYYINSGVLLINIQYWRARDMERQLTKVVSAYPFPLKYPDQDIINLVLHEKIKILPLRYNTCAQLLELEDKDLAVVYQQFDGCCSMEDIKVAKYHPIAIHYSGLGKPWELGGIGESSYLYRHYKELSIWNETPYVQASRKKKLSYLLFSKMSYEKYLDIRKKVQKVKKMIGLLIQ